MIRARELLAGHPGMAPPARAPVSGPRPGQRLAAGGLWGAFLSLAVAFLGGQRRLLILTPG